MTSDKVEKNITVIGSHLYQPVADLLGRLLKRNFQSGDRVSSNYYESGYSAAIILLLFTAVESFVQRDQYFLTQSKPKAKASPNVSDYVRTVLKYRSYKRVIELFDVRNAIAHNHMWEIEYSLKLEGGRRHKKSTVVPKTHRLSKAPPTNARVPRTAILKIHLSSSSLDRTDVQKALNAVIHLLGHISKKGNNPVNLVREQVGLNGKRINFSDLPGEI